MRWMKVIGTQIEAGMRREVAGVCQVVTRVEPKTHPATGARYAVVEYESGHREECWDGTTYMVACTEA